MEEETVPLNASNDTCLNRSRDSQSTVTILQEPFLHFDPNSELSFKDKSRIYNSLVALVKAEYPFDAALQDRAARFLDNLKPKWFESNLQTKLVNELVPSSAGSHSGFNDSILTLLSSPHTTVVAATMSFLQKSMETSLDVICRHAESDLISNVLATVQPHTLPIAGNEAIIKNLIEVIQDSVNLALQSNLIKLGKTLTVDKWSHREMYKDEHFGREVVFNCHSITQLLGSNVPRL